MRADADPSSVNNRQPSRLAAWLQGLVAAFQFLSRFPIPIRIDYDHATFRRSVPFYPLVGCAIGLLLWGLAYVATTFLPLLPAAVLVLIGWVGITGGLHLDGLMDTADGILSHRPREQMLEIMKDSRVGAMGVIACVLHLSLKLALIYSLLDKGWLQALLPLVLIPVWSRWWMTASIAYWPYARPNSGMGSFFKETPRRYVAFGAILCLLISASVGAVAMQQAATHAWVSYPAFSLIVVAVMLAVGLAASGYFSRKLGGLTGDTYGAANELLETAGLLAAVVLLY